MAVEWTRHRFSGGVLALDVANTVVHRLKPALRFDRLEDAAEIARFAAAASGMCAEAVGGLDGAADAAAVIELREATDALFRVGVSEADFDPHSVPASPVYLSPDRGGRGSASVERHARLPPETEMMAAPILAPSSPPGRGRGGPAKPGRSGGASNAKGKHLPRFLRACAAALDAGAARQAAHGAIPLEAALATSALALLHPPLRSRIRVCANCDWLFLDRSRNASRIWCDMAVCGNRAKAKRHYRRSRAEIGEDRHAH